MSIQMKSSLSPHHLKLVVIGAGIFVLVAVWDVVQERVSNLNYQPIYGEQGGTSAEALREELYSLPIVVARSESANYSESEISDADIEAAFREPVVEVPETEEAKPVKITLTQQFLALYRPVVDALASNGAIVNGQFWSIGEAMVSMPLRTSSGDIVIPRMRSIGAARVVVDLGDESLSIDFAN